MIDFLVQQTRESVPVKLVEIVANINCFKSRGYLIPVVAYAQEQLLQSRYRKTAREVAKELDGSDTPLVHVDANVDLAGRRLVAFLDIEAR